MAEQVVIGELLAKVEADISGLRTEFDKVVQTMTAGSHKMEGSVEGVSSALTGLFKRYAGFVIGEEALRRSVVAFMDAEVAAVRLDSTLKSTGRNAAVLGPLLMSLASTGQVQSIFSDEEIIRGQEILATYTTISDAALPALSQTLLDLAAKTGSVELAARLLGQAAEGNTERFRRYGLSVSEGAKASNDLNRIVADLTPQIRGMSAALADTAHGRMVQLKNAFNNTQEAMGALIAIPLVPFLEALQTPVAVLTASFAGLEFVVTSSIKAFTFIGKAAGQFAAGGMAGLKDAWDDYNAGVNRDADKLTARIDKLKTDFNKRNEGPGGEDKGPDTSGLSKEAQRISDKEIERNRQVGTQYVALLNQRRSAEISSLVDQRRAGHERITLQDAQRKQQISDMRLEVAEEKLLMTEAGRVTAAERVALEKRIQIELRDAREDNLKSAMSMEASLTDDLQKQSTLRFNIMNIENQARARKLVEQGMAQEEADKVLAKQTELARQQSVRSARGQHQILLDDWKNVTKQLESATAGWLRTSADMLVDFVYTGKLNFKDFADSVIKDIFRIMVQEQMSQILRGSGGGDGGLIGAAISAVSGYFGGGESATGYADHEADISAIPGHAHGADFMVGGSGGVDSQLVQFRASPNERVTVTTPGQQQSQGGSGVTIVQQITVNAGVSQTVRSEMMAMMPAIMENSKKGVLEAIYSGGEMAKAVGRRR